MSAELKIVVSANSSEAVQGLKKLDTEAKSLKVTLDDVSKVTAKSFRPFTQEMMEAQNKSESLVKTISSYNLHMKQFSNVTTVAIENADSLTAKYKLAKQALAFFNKELEEARSQGKIGGENGLANQLSQNVNTWQQKAAGYKKQIDAEKEAIRIQKESVKFQQEAAEYLRQEEENARQAAQAVRDLAEAYDEKNRTALQEFVDTNKRSDYEKYWEDRLQAEDEFQKTWEEAKKQQEQYNTKQAEVEQLELLGTRYDKITAQLNRHKKTLGELLLQKQKEGKVTDDLKKKIDAEVVSIKKLTKEQEKASRTSFLSKMLSIAKNIMGFQMAIALFRKTTTAFTQTLHESVQAAAEAEQIYSKLGTVFEGVVGSMEKAKDVASTLGVANSTAANALSTVGDLLQAQGMGATESLQKASEWVKQFQDIIAFKDINMSLGEFAQNFMSGAAGNLRNFRTFGSIVKESAVQAELLKRGLDGLTGSQLELAKMTIRAEMALDQQANAMGATEREWDTALSVSRRLNEAWKEFKENLGDTLIKYVNPIRRGITGILEDANKANRAMKGEAVYTGVNEVNGDDYKLFRSELLRLKGTNDIQTRSGAETYLKALKNLPTKKTLDFLFQDVEGSMTKRERERIRPIVDSIIEAIKAERELKAIEDARAEALAIANDNLAKYKETLEDINGVGGLTDILLDDKGDLGTGEGLLSTQAFASLGLRDLDFFTDKLDNVFDKTKATKDAYDAWLSSIRSLYAIVESKDPESELLDKLLLKYEEILKLQKEFEAGLKGSSFLSALQSLVGVGSGWTEKFATYGLTERGQASYENRKKLDEALYKLGPNADSAQTQALWNQYYENEAGIASYFDMTETMARLQKVSEEAIKSDLGYDSSYEHGNEWENGGREEYESFVSAVEEFHDTVSNDVASIFGKGGTLANSIKNFVQNHDMGSEEGIQNAKDLWSAIFAILKETEAFQKILEGVDTALSAVDSILAPFIPYIDMINRQAQQLMEVLQPLIPVIKVVSSVLTIMQASLMSVFVAIKGVVQTVLGSIMSFVYDIANGIVDIFQGIGWGKVKVFGKTILHSFNLADALGMRNFSKPAWVSDWADGFDLGSAEEEIWDEMNDTLYKIWNTSEKIAFNTSEDNSKILEELNYLYAHGIIDANTYNARVNSATGSNYLDTVSSNGIWNNGFAAGRVTNNVNVTINGSGLSKDELESALTNALTKITGNSVYVQTQAASFA